MKITKSSVLHKVHKLRVRFISGHKFEWYRQFLIENLLKLQKVSWTASQLLDLWLSILMGCRNITAQCGVISTISSHSLQTKVAKCGGLTMPTGTRRSQGTRQLEQKVHDHAGPEIYDGLNQISQKRGWAIKTCGMTTFCSLWATDLSHHYHSNTGMDLLHPNLADFVKAEMTYCQTLSCFMVFLTTSN